MSDCCSSNCSEKTSHKKQRCPVNRHDYKAVAIKTITHHIKAPWAWKGQNQTYYFCDDPDCAVVYFSEDGTTIRQSDLRTSVGIKDKSAQATLCYCFGVSRADAAANPHIKQYVTQQTKQEMCACDTSNPSGKCCLKNFPVSRKS